MENSILSTCARTAEVIDGQGLSSTTLIGQDRGKIEHTITLIIDQSEVSGRAALTKEEDRLIGCNMGHDLVYVVCENVSLSSENTYAVAAFTGRGEMCSFSKETANLSYFERSKETRINFFYLIKVLHLFLQSAKGIFENSILSIQSRPRSRGIGVPVISYRLLSRSQLLSHRQIMGPESCSILRDTIVTRCVSASNSRLHDSTNLHRGISVGSRDTPLKRKIVSLWRDY